MGFRAIRLSALLSLLSLLGSGGIYGCGLSSDAATDASQTSAWTRPKNLIVKGPISGGDMLPPPVIPHRFRCGHAVWMPLHWAKVPERARELAIAILWSRVERIGQETEASVSEVWIIGGLDPHQRKLAVGPLSHGAFLSKEHNGSYSCPSSSGEEYRVEFRVYAVPTAKFLRPADLFASSPRGKGLETLKRLEERAIARGLLAGTYRG